MPETEVMTAHSAASRLQRLAVGGFAALLATAAAAAALPAAGDTYVYRVVNAYNNEARGEVSYRVERAEADRVVMAVTTTPGATGAGTAVYTADGRWLHHALINRDQPVVYDFAPAYPAYDFPLQPGKTWSTRVEATNPASGRRNSVRVDARVVGNERVRVPAGEFDTVRIARSVYAGDADYPKQETTITETEWYAPALGRSVKLVSNSFYVDNSLFYQYQVVRGDWNVFELVSAPAARRDAPTSSRPPTEAP